MQCAPTHIQYTNPHRQTGDVRANLQAPEVLNAVRNISCVPALCFDLGNVSFGTFLWESVQLPLNALPLPLLIISINLIQIQSPRPATAPVTHTHACS